MNELCEVTKELLYVVLDGREVRHLLLTGWKRKTDDEINKTITQLFGMSNLIRQAARTDLFAIIPSQTRCLFDDQFELLTMVKSALSLQRMSIPGLFDNLEELLLKDGMIAATSETTATGWSASSCNTSTRMV
jgi:hypothetical protein